MPAVTEMTSIDSIRKGNVLLDFYTSTCAPCKAMNPVLDEIANEFKSLTVAKVEVTKHPDAAQMFGVMSVPTIVLIVDSQVKETSCGFYGREKLKSMVRKHVSA